VLDYCEMCGERSCTRSDFLRVHWFSYVFMSPPLFHTHSLIYHRCYVILAVDCVLNYRALEFDSGVGHYAAIYALASESASTVITARL
jgi:hypothetical protein